MATAAIVNNSQQPQAQHREASGNRVQAVQQQQQTTTSAITESDGYDHDDAAAHADPLRNRVILCSGGYDHTIRYWNAEKGFCEKIINQSDNSHVSFQY